MISTFGEYYELCLYSRGAKIHNMSLLSPVEIVEIIKTLLLPGLIALASILVVSIAFLLERYTRTKYEPDKETYRDLTWHMTVALIIGVADIIFSLPIILGIGDIICEQAFLVYFTIVLILFCICLLLVCTGTFKTVKKILKKG